MKTMLNILTTAILVTSSATLPLVQQHSNINTTGSKDTTSSLKIDTVANNEFYYNDDHSSWEVFNENNWMKSYHYFKKTFFVPRNDFEYYTHVKFYDPNNESYTKVSWGDWDHYGDDFTPWAPFSIAEDAHYGDINDDSVDWQTRVEKWVVLTLLNWKTNSGAVSFSSKQAIGFSYIASFAGGKTGYEFSIFGYQKTFYSWGAISGGASWTNLGSGLQFIKR